MPPVLTNPVSPVKQLGVVASPNGTSGEGDGQIEKQNTKAPIEKSNVKIVEESETLVEGNEEEPRKLWVDVISDNRNPAKGRPMEYVAPTLVNGEVVIKIEEEDVESELYFWKNALILCVLGADLSMSMLKSYMQRVWNFVHLPDLYYHDEGYFILHFRNHEDMDVVLMKGPYTYRNMPLLLMEWRQDFDIKKDLMRTLPLWVKLPQLPLHLWGATSLNKIGSAIGTPLVTDECTTHKLRVSYARMLVEVDITHKLLEEITITDHEGRQRKQAIEYEWKPKFCDKCQQIGHQCQKVVQAKIWQPKEKKVNPEQKQEVNLATPKQIAIPEVEEEQNWTTITRTQRGRGKIMAYAESSNINCVNGFKALGDSHQDPFDRGPLC